MNLRRPWLAALLLAAAPGVLAAQDAATNALVARVRARARDVHDLTLHVTSQGVPLTVFAAPDSDGSYQVSYGFGKAAFESEYLGDWSATADALLLGMEETAGDAQEAVTHDGIVSTADGPMYSLTLRAPPGEGTDAQGRGVDRITLLLDTASLMTRHVVFVAATGPGSSGTIDAEFGDYRSVGGTVVPFRRRVTFRGVREMYFSGGLLLQSLVARGHAGEATMGAPQRAQLQLLDALLARDEMVLDERVDSVEVNRGPPPGVPLIHSSF
jgi:hypothetical protein